MLRVKVSWTEQVPQDNETPFSTYEEQTLRSVKANLVAKTFEGEILDYIWKGQGNVHAVILYETMLLDRPIHMLTVGRS